VVKQLNSVVAVSTTLAYVIPTHLSNYNNSLNPELVLISHGPIIADVRLSSEHEADYDVKHRGVDASIFPGNGEGFGMDYASAITNSESKLFSVE
jgi:hypothetical protein